MSCKIANPLSSFNLPNALSYISSCYDPAVGLCHENAANPTKYWLWTDNIVASKALKVNGYNTVMQTSIDSRVQSYMTTFGIATMQHAIVAVCDQANSAFSNLGTLDTQDSTSPNIWHTATPGPGTLLDTDYADIAFLHSINLYNTGNPSAAQTAYNAAVAQFDGIGFADTSWKASVTREYQTFKAALWVIAHKITHFAPTPKIGLVDRLFARLQDVSGGSRTGYMSDYSPGVSGINVETTGLVVMAASMPV